jgi:hypothetical protein
METQRCANAVINTTYIERLNATFRGRLAPLARRTRAGVHQRRTLEAGMWLAATTSVGRIEACVGERTTDEPPGGRWVEYTPAEAAGLSDRCWSMHKLLSFAVPPTDIRKRRGRRPRWLVEAAHAA